MEKLSLAQKELETKHGTPREFAEAVTRAWADLFITTDEMYKAIGDYEILWLKAGDQS